MSTPPLRVQGRIIEPAHLEQIRQLLLENPSWGRSRLSSAICQLWDWKDGAGRYKEMACRTMLLKLQAMELLVLPARMRAGRGSRIKIAHAPQLCTSALTASLGDIAPIELVDARSCRDSSRLFTHLLSTYHYLGFRDVGRNMKYLALERSGRPVGCLLFGSAAWKAQPRDLFIGWDAPTRAANLHLLVNNTRFLIAPWVRVPHLASHLLARAAARLPNDWMARYGYRPAMLETFVDRSRFGGICYRAANWICVGQTKGRSRQDRYNKLKLSVKDLYLYPLRKDAPRWIKQISSNA